MRPIFILLIFSALLTSCAAVSSKRPIDPGTDIPQNWSALPLEAGQTDSLWWQAFGDAQLDSLIREAFRHNHSLQIAAANVEAAQAQSRIAGAPLYPQANLAASAGRRKQNFIGLPIPSARDGVLSNLSNSFGVSLDLSWEVDVWGRLRADRLAALANYQAAEADYYGAQLSLAAQVSKVWFAAVEAQRQVVLAEATVENYRLSQERVRQRYESGLTPSLDLRRSLANLAAAEATLSQRKAQHDGIVRQLEILLGRYPAAALTARAELPALPEAVPAGLPAELIARRPDLIAAERRLLAADAGVASARRALYPRINLTGSSGTSSNELKDILNGDFSIWSIAGSLLQPVFQGGRLRANLKLNRSQAEIAQARYVQSLLFAFGEVEGALAGERFLNEQEKALTRATEQALAARDLAETQYASGISDYLNVLDAQRSAYQNESQLLSVRRERLNAWIDLQLALGGGFGGADYTGRVELN